jgi:hypothetical protein
MNLLIVEDDRKQLQMYEDTIASFNKEYNTKITPDVFNTLREGLDAIQKPLYDSAIIDLKLSSNNSGLEGMTLVDAIRGRLRIPIFIVSGSLAQVSFTETALFKLYKRDGNFRDVLKEIKSVYDTGITRFMRQDGEIDKMLTSIFWKHLAHDLKLWEEHKNPQTLLRYILSYFQEYLDISPDGDFEEYHPSEVYIKPPVKKHFHTGDLVLFDRERYLIITPACDIVLRDVKNTPEGGKMKERKATHLTLVKALDFNYKDLCKRKNGSLEKSKLADYINNKFFRYHYLPPYEGNSGFLLDFEDVKSVDFSWPLSRIAAISSPFIKDIISRFANYY